VQPPTIDISLEVYNPQENKISLSANNIQGNEVYNPQENIPWQFIFGCL
jgi:hypothetical protein